MQDIPSGALRLFDPGLEGWRARRGGPARWNLLGDVVEVEPGAGDLVSVAEFGDHQLHLEFWLPSMPWAQGQARANSGVYLQGRYELQVLDSYGIAQPRFDDCGALYRVAPPLRNAALPPEQWQYLDVALKAPRDGRPGALTVFWNGVLIHNHQPLTAPTPGALDEALELPGPLLLQDHGDRVRFRNGWVLPGG